MSIIVYKHKRKRMKQVEAACPQVKACFAAEVLYNNNSHERKLGINFVHTDNEKVILCIHELVTFI